MASLASILLIVLLQPAPAGQRPRGEGRPRDGAPIPLGPQTPPPQSRPSSHGSWTPLLSQLPIWIVLIANARRQQRLRAERLRLMTEEEQEKTPYSEDDLMQDVEFKIIRNDLNLFDQPQLLTQALTAEAAAGWTLVEKFDGNRVRLKRSASFREQDGALPPGVDAYRTNVLPEATQAALAAKRARDLRIFGYTFSGCLAAAIVLGLIAAALPNEPFLPQFLAGFLAIMAGVFAAISFVVILVRGLSGQGRC